jgi:putative endopeptidase
LRIETALAKAQMSRVEMRDPYKTYNKYGIKEFNSTTPSIDWNWMLGQFGLQGADSMIVTNPAFFKSMDILLTALPLEDWKTYVKWHLLNSSADYLSSAFVKEDFAFTKVLTGQKEQTPRWQRVSGLIDGSLGDLLGQLYVNKYFKPEAKKRMLDLVNNLQQTFAGRIRQLDWMSDETKTKALEKLNAFTKKIAYPDTWRDYKEITIARNDYLGNARRVSQWMYNDMITRYGKPVDKTRWSMTPPTINAYYNPSNNEIVFPAGILQYPFFDFGADDAVNYGGIGAVIGHEMTHGFDDQGSQFAADGNLKNWWSKVDAEKFKERTALVVDQYNGYTVLDTIHVNGKLTLGENLADLGGLNMAYAAFMNTDQYKKGKTIDGFTPTQRFFLNWAQVWRNNALPETQAQLILTDPHSPGMHRANGPLVNMDAWYQAFNVQPGDKMYRAPEKRIHIW